MNAALKYNIPMRPVDNITPMRADAPKFEQAGILAELTPEKTALELARICINTEPPPAQILATIDNSTFATAENFSCLIGKAKSRKTFFVVMVIAAFISGQCGTIAANKLPGKKRIIWFDTEQSRHHVWRAMKRANDLAGGANNYTLEVYALRPYPTTDRMKMILHVLTELNPDNDIALVVIDGIRDTVFDINSPEEATNTANWLMKVTEERKLHIITVLHTNKADSNARGHLGTEMINKAETTLLIEKDPKDGNISIVKAEYCRDKEFTPFVFTVNEHGLPVILGDRHPSTADTSISAKWKPSDLPIDTHRQCAWKVFRNTTGFSYIELQQAIKLQMNEDGYQFGNTKAQDTLAYWRKCQIVESNGESGRKSRYQLVEDEPTLDTRINAGNTG